MLELFLTENISVYEKLKTLLARTLKKDFEILRRENGKPYIDGDPLFFSLSHSGKHALIALSDKPVGADIEVIKERKLNAVLSSLTERERQETGGRLAEFYTNWTVKEAYIKLCGGTLAHDLKRLEYFGGTLYCDGKKAACGYFTVTPEGGFICSVCAEGYSAEDIVAAGFKRI